MTTNTTERRVLVTGASRGIGRATALRLAKAGYQLTLHYHSQADAAQALAEEIQALGTSANTLQFDAGDRAQCQQVLEATVAECGAFYGVVCNAGIAKDNAFPALSGDDWDDVVQTNLTGFYNILHPLVMPMIRLRDGGRIVTLSSVAGMAGNRGQVNYSAAKAGIIGATKALAIELAKRKITVNCVAPGFIETDMTADLPIPKEELKKMVPLGAAGKPEDVAGAIAFLMSDEARYITRQVISVNGGML